MFVGYLLLKNSGNSKEEKNSTSDGIGSLGCLGMILLLVGFVIILPVFVYVELLFSTIMIGLIVVLILIGLYEWLFK